MTWHILATAVVFYLYLLSARLTSPHPKAAPQSVSTADLDNVKYDDIDLRQGIPQPTNKVYAIIGGSGFVGTFIVRLLLLRGESRILILDINPPNSSVASHPAVTFIRTDITSPQSLSEALTSSDHPPILVIYLTAALIRFWEGSSYSWHLSYNVNVRGTENVLNVVKDIGRDVVLVYTSSAETVIPRSNALRLGSDFNTPPLDTVIVSDYDPPITPSHASQSCYARSKTVAERLIVSANGQNGLKRESFAQACGSILGPSDRPITSVLSMGVVPEWDAQHSHTNVCVWDVAAAHLLLEDALTKRAEEVGGESFLVTGERQAWKIGDLRRAVKHYASKSISLVSVPPLPIYILMHVIEFFLFLRFYFLLPFHFVLFRSKPSVNPKWMGELVYLQPLTMELMANDVAIDDSRARKILGYQPQWTTAQVIKYTVDEFQSGRSIESGLKLKS